MPSNEVNQEKDRERNSKQPKKGVPDFCGFSVNVFDRFHDGPDSLEPIRLDGCKIGFQKFPALNVVLRDHRFDDMTVYVRETIVSPLEKVS